jgi:hypothetical protein
MRRRLWLRIGPSRRRRLFVAQNMIGRTGDSKTAGPSGALRRTTATCQCRGRPPCCWTGLTATIHPAATT